MRKLIKILLLLLLILLVFSAVLVENHYIATMFNLADFLVYIRIASLLGLILAIVLALEFKRRYETTQKYRRADQILAESKAMAKRRERATMLLEEKLKAEYQRKADAVAVELDEVKAEFVKKIAVMKAQNIQLKEAVSKLMAAIKKGGGQGKAHTADKTPDQGKRPFHRKMKDVNGGSTATQR